MNKFVELSLQAISQLSLCDIGNDLSDLPVINVVLPVSYPG